MSSIGSPCKKITSFVYVCGKAETLLSMKGNGLVMLVAEILYLSWARKTTG